MVGKIAFLVFILVLLCGIGDISSMSLEAPIVTYNWQDNKSLFEFIDLWKSGNGNVSLDFPKAERIISRDLDNYKCEEIEISV